jgi:methanogenic corrinoid protein MtbC1
VDAHRTGTELNGEPATVSAAAAADREATDRATVRATLIAELVERFALADRWGAVTRARELLRDGVPPSELREVIGAAVRHVGDLWQTGRWTITQEHAATAVAEAVLTNLEAEPASDDAPPVGTVAVVAAEGEWHALPARLASHAFEAAGLEVRYLGAGLPAEDVARTLPSAGVDVLAVSITLTANLAGAARTIAAGRAAGLPVVVGGAASSPSRAAALGADAHAADVEAGATIARTWCVDGAPDPASPTVDLRTVATFRRDRERLRDAAYAATEARWPPLADAAEVVIDRTCEDLELHLDHLAAALLVGEDEAYLDLVRWLAEVHLGRELPAEALTAQVGALTELLDGTRLAPLLEAAAGVAAEGARR